MGVFEDIRPHEMAELKGIARELSGTAGGERMLACLEAYEEVQKRNTELDTLEDEVAELAAGVKDIEGQVLALRDGTRGGGADEPLGETKTPTERIDALGERLASAASALEDEVAKVRDSKARSEAVTKAEQTLAKCRVSPGGPLPHDTELGAELVELADLDSGGKTEEAKTLASRMLYEMSPSRFRELANLFARLASTVGTLDEQINAALCGE